MLNNKIILSLLLFAVMGMSLSSVNAGYISTTLKTDCYMNYDYIYLVSVVVRDNATNSTLELNTPSSVDMCSDTHWDLNDESGLTFFGDYKRGFVIFSQNDSQYLSACGIFQVVRQCGTSKLTQYMVVPLVNDINYYNDYKAGGYDGIHFKNVNSGRELAWMNKCSSQDERYKVNHYNAYDDHDDAYNQAKNCV